MKFKNLFLSTLSLSYLCVNSGCKSNTSNSMSAEDKTCLIQFDTKSDEGIISEKITYGESIKAPEIKKEGYKFNGWLLDGKIVDINYLNAYDDYSFVADWEKATYNISFKFYNLSDYPFSSFKVDYPTTASFNESLDFSIQFRDEFSSIEQSNIKFVWSVNEKVYGTYPIFHYLMPSDDINVSLTILDYHSHTDQENTNLYSYNEDKQAFSATIYKLENPSEFPSHYCGIPIYSITPYMTIRKDETVNWKFPDTTEIIDLEYYKDADNINSITIGKNTRLIRGLPICVKSLNISKENPYYSDGGVNLLLNKKETILYNATNGATNIPSTILCISKKAFSEYAGRTDLVLPKSLKEIQSTAFYNAKLDKIAIPSSIQTIEESAFYNINCPTIECEKNNYYYTDSYHTCLIRKEDEALISTSNDFLSIPDGVKIIGRNSLNNQHYSSIESLVLPDSVTDFLPIDSKKIQNITLGSRLKNIASLSFLSNFDITVTEKNDTYASLKGCLLDKKTRALLVVGRKNTIPEEITSVISFNSYSYVNQGNKKYILQVSPWKTKSYTLFNLPDHIKEYYGSNFFSPLNNIPTNISFNKADIIHSNAILINEWNNQTIFLPKGIKKIEKYMAYDNEKSDYCDHITFYCEDETKPDGWDNDWNSYQTSDNRLIKINTVYGTTREAYQKILEDNAKAVD